MHGLLIERSEIVKEKRKTSQGSLLRTKNKIVECEETLILDQRSVLQPAQAVEQKVRLLLKNKAVPLSILRMTPLGNGRRHC